MAKNKMYKSIVVRGRKMTKKKKGKKKQSPFSGTINPDKLMSILAYEHKHGKGGTA